MRQKIMLHAKQEIFKSGFRFTMADIARQCGVSTKTIYECFSSKEELIRDLVQQAIDEIKEREQIIIHDQTLTTMDKLKALLVLLPQDFQFFDIKRLYELQRYYSEVWEYLNTFMEEQWDGVDQIVAEAQAEGLLGTFNRALFIQLYIGGLNRLMEQASVDQIGLTLREALYEMVEIMINGIKMR
ncbi:TetR/AcrR family transcriptional regulator [Paenibacillus sp. N1-5-1-14]|uniref:TetR/AcrR family transcriptional regulator n=1 Tax=Paenibacillus radicibacter TaxID=2972488 RepID=UPI0021597334|nr:TetR/AcrR family transcriptional regulator [Paenibacillus radicibacter]MCR8645421.1 TetR/AcrR family transcriptional regulator [Paenibacillus radicibacter]